jgi:hypothetical protein
VLQRLSQRPRQDSNLRTCLRRAVLYPLSYGGQGRGNSTAPPEGYGRSTEISPNTGGRKMIELPLTVQATPYQTLSVPDQRRITIS